MRISSGKAINVWVLVASLTLFISNIHKTSNTSTSAREKLALANSTLKNIDRKMLRMGLKRTHIIYQSRASWYGGYFHGRTTANMETFNKNLLSAAHKTLPLNTYLLVTNLNNGKKIIVRVNDRGPYIKGRSLDLSEAAAKIIGSYSKGVVPVKYEVLTRA